MRVPSEVMGCVLQKNLRPFFCKMQSRYIRHGCTNIADNGVIINILYKMDGVY